MSEPALPVAMDGAAASPAAVPVIPTTSKLTSHSRSASASELRWNAAQQAAVAAASSPSTSVPSSPIDSCDVSSAARSLLTLPPPLPPPAPTTVLLTSNLQTDFFTRFPKRKDTMSRVWVGRKESERVLGLDPARGPLAQLMAWVRAVAAGGDGGDGGAPEAMQAAAAGAAGAGVPSTGAAASSSVSPPPAIPAASIAASQANIIPNFHDTSDPSDAIGRKYGTVDDADPDPEVEAEVEYDGDEALELECVDDRRASDEEEEEEATAATAALLHPHPPPPLQVDSPGAVASSSPVAARQAAPSSVTPVWTLKTPPSSSSTSASASAAAGLHSLRSPAVVISPSSCLSSAPGTPISSSPLAPLSAAASASPHAPATDAVASAVAAQRLLAPLGVHRDGVSWRRSRSRHSSASAAAAAAAATPLPTPLPPLPPDRPGLYVIHLRTSIDPSAMPPAQAAECLERFGAYCIAGSSGTRLCAGMDENLGPHECIINTNRLLSSHTYRALKRKLKQIRQFVQRKYMQRVRLHAAHVAAAYAAAGLPSPAVSSSTPLATSSFRVPPLKVAVIGGWTDEDVYHLCYELRTRFQGTSLATCSVLTASPSASQHWNALAQLKRVMNVSVTRTVKELIAWIAADGVGMVPYRLLGVPFRPPRLWPNFEWVGGTAAIPRNFSDTDGEILAHLYRTSARIRIATLVGGYSNSMVLSIESEDHSRVREAPSVVKLASRTDVATEWQAFQRVEEMLGNNAPQVRGVVELGDRAGIKFRYTRMSGGGVRRLLDLAEDLTLDPSAPDSLAAVLSMLDEVYGEIFGVWYASASSEQFSLFSYFFDGFFLSHGAEPVSMVHQEPLYLKGFISYVLAKNGTDDAPHFRKDRDFYSYPPFTEETFQFPGASGPPLTNLGLLFERKSGMPYLRTLPPRRLYSTFAHGDANLQNFLIDSRNNIWVIDFFFTEPRQHVLRDMSKTFSCVMYIAATLRSDAQFAQAVLISREIAQARDLHTPLPTHIEGLSDAHVKAIYAILCRLWFHAGRIVKDRSGSVQFQLALVAESMRFFLYSCKNIYSKRWALATAVLLSESVLLQEKRIHDVTPSWVSLRQFYPMVKGQLGMTRSPGNRNYLRFERRPQEQPTPQAPFGFKASAAASAAAAAKGTTTSSGGVGGSTPLHFRGELSQSERVAKESTERLSVQAAHARERMERGHEAEMSRLKADHERILLEQREEKSRYEAAAAAAAAAALDNCGANFAPSGVVVTGASPSPVPPITLRSVSSSSGAKQQLALADDDEDGDVEDDRDDEGRSPSQHYRSNGASGAQEHAHLSSTANGETDPQLSHSGGLTRSDSTMLGSFFHLHEELDSRAPGGGASEEGGVGALAQEVPSTLFAPNIGQGIIGPRHLVTHMATVNERAADGIFADSAASASTIDSGASASSGAPVHPKKMPRLQKECMKLAEEGVTHMLLLITDAEFKEMGVDKARLQLFLSRSGIEVITVSLPPGILQVPLLTDLVKLCLGILCDEAAYKLVLVSKGGFHRAGTLAACILCALGSAPEQAIRLVREARGAQAIGRDAREKQIARFDLAWKLELIKTLTQNAGAHAQQQQPPQQQQSPDEMRESTGLPFTPPERQQSTAGSALAQSYTFF